MKTRMKFKQQWRLPVAGLVIVLILVVFLLIRCSGPVPEEEPVQTEQPTTVTEVTIPTEPLTLEAFAAQNGLSMSEWPVEILELLEKNPETEQFVWNYPLKKDLEVDIDLSEYIGSEKVPLLLQWDQRWGYVEYTGKVMGLSGCGPTCLSMVCLYLLDDAKYTPKYIAAFAEENGYCTPGSGSFWTLISEGGKQLGLDVQEIPLDEKRIMENLEQGNPIICNVKEGFFTTSGHYIVLTEYADGYVKVNDPNSVSKSEQLWNLTEVMEQIRNLWVCKAPG